MLPMLLESPGFVEFAVHLWRAGLAIKGDGLVAAAEMLPGLQQIWLVDGRSDRYTSELRIVAVES